MEFNFTESEKSALLKLARDTISSKLNNTVLPSFDLGIKKFEQPGAAFVTLHKKGELRGCIGYIQAVQPLNKTIQKMSLAAAFEDPRFNPLEKNELKNLQIEISVLSPMQHIKDISEIKIGKHGIYLQKGFASGLFLPQVATEQGWDVLEFVENVCYKAGLSKNSWQSAQLFIFTAEIFSEK